MVVTETDPAASETSTLNDENFVHILVPRERMAPLDNRLIITVEHQVSQSAGPHDATPVLHFVAGEMPAPT